MQNIDGLRIDIAPIESALASHPAVREAAVIVSAVPGSQHLVAYVAIQRRARNPVYLEAIPERRRYALPNGLVIAHQTRVEADHFYEDIFDKQIYMRHGIALYNDACVFDVGANIGLFSLFVHHQAYNARVYAFEPAPPVFETLSMNMAAHGVDVTLFNCGVSNTQRTAEFTFYPHSTGMSSFYADKQEEQAILRAIMSHHIQEQTAGIDEVMQFADELLEARFKAATFTCALRTLASVIAEHAIDRIDLLKIDVQKAELDVLHGIDEGNWAKVQQIVMEVHDIDGRLQQVVQLLRQHGFTVAVEQDELHTNTILYNLFARRAEAPGSNIAGPAAQATPHPNSTVITADDLRHFLRDWLPDPMLPSAFVMVDALPRTPTGTIDRALLGAWYAKDNSRALASSPVENAAHSALERGHQRAEARRLSTHRQKEHRQRSREQPPSSHGDEQP